jgi:hypothetical protein
VQRLLLKENYLIQIHSKSNQFIEIKDKEKVIKTK